jgi:hypothetical protein
MNYIIIDNNSVIESMTVRRIRLDEEKAMIESDNLIGFESYQEYSESEAQEILNSLRWKPMETDGFTFTTWRELKAYHIEQANLETEGMNMTEIEATYTQAYANISQ